MMIMIMIMMIIIIIIIIIATFFAWLYGPPEGAALLLDEVSVSHSDTPHSVGLLWENDRPVAEKSTSHFKTFTRGRHPFSRRN